MNNFFFTVAETPETRGSKVDIPIPEYAIKWAISTKLAAKHKTREIGIEVRKSKNNEIMSATKEFNTLVHSKFKDLCIQAGVEAPHRLAGIAKKLIAYKVNGRFIALEETLKYVSDKYKPIIMQLINDPELIEAYKRIEEAKRSDMSDPYRAYEAKVMTDVWEDLMLGREDTYDYEHPYGKKWSRNWASYKDVLERINSAARNNNITFEAGLKSLLISTIYKIVKTMKKKVASPNEVEIAKEIEIAKGLAIRYCMEMGNKNDNCAKFIDEVIGVAAKNNCCNNNPD